MAMNPQIAAPRKSIAGTRNSKGPMRLAMERFLKNKMAMISVIVLLIIVLSAVFAPLLTHWSPTAQDLANTDAPPSAVHLLGTDNSGTDYFARDLYGGRIDLLVGFVDTVIVMAISIILGGIAGFYGGWLDSVIMRACDFMLNFPFLLLVIVLSSIFNTTSVWLLIAVIGATGWPGTTRLIRGLFMTLRESDYVVAAKIAGAGSRRIILRHLLPGSLGPLVVNGTLMIAGMVASEAALAVIGFGVKPPTASWGNVLNASMDFFTLSTEPWAWIPPAFLITITILCINFIGDGLRDAFDPSFEK